MSERLIVPEYWDAFAETQKLILVPERKGVADCHGHPFTEGTLTQSQYSELEHKPLEWKWEEADRVRASPFTLATFPARLDRAVLDRMRQNIFYARFYVDIGPDIGTEAVRIAVQAKKKFARQGFYMQIAAYPMQGIDRSEELRLLSQACSIKEVEAIGCTPSRGRSGVSDIDTSRDRMAYYAGLAHSWDKILDAHLDQKNHPEEKETAEFVRVIRAHRSRGYGKPVGATHCVSISKWEDENLRMYTFNEMRELRISLIVCHRSNLNNEQLREVRARTSNSVAPWDTALNCGVNVAIGIDNIRDLYMPFSDGDIWKELSALIDGVRWQGDIARIADLFTKNGQKALFG